MSVKQKAFIRICKSSKEAKLKQGHIYNVTYAEFQSRAQMRLTFLLSILAPYVNDEIDQH